MNRPLRVSTRQDIDRLETIVVAAADKTAEKISKLRGPGICRLAQMKFEQVGFSPDDETRPLNLIEQVNQTFSSLVTLEALKFLRRQHPKKAFIVHLGTAGGSDIESEDGAIAAEVFAAVDLRNNGKMKKDIEKVGRTKARYKYVFAMCPTFNDAFKEWENISTSQVRVYIMGVRNRGQSLL
jgi:hypothetical protein